MIVLLPPHYTPPTHTTSFLWERGCGLKRLYGEGVVGEMNPGLVRLCLRVYVGQIHADWSGGVTCVVGSGQEKLD